MAYVNRGFAYEKKGDYDREIADCTEAIRLDPKLAMAYNNRGVAYGLKGDYDREIADCTEAIRLDPKLAKAYGNRGFAYGRKGDYDRAIADCTEAIRLDPKLAAKAYIIRGFAYGRKGDTARATPTGPEPCNSIPTSRRGDPSRPPVDPRRCGSIQPSPPRGLSRIERHIRTPDNAVGGCSRDSDGGIGTMADAPRVFCTYSHDSDEHADRVLALADALCDRGIDVTLDRYVHPAPAEGWPRWMERNIDAAQFVLMVCTEIYRRLALGLEEPGKGLGVRWINSLIYHRINKDKSTGSRFIPILLPGSEPGHIPTPVLGHSHYQITSFDFSDPGYEGLYRHLTGQPATPRPDLGTIQILPPKPRPQAVPGPLPPSG